MDFFIVFLSKVTLILLTLGRLFFGGKVNASTVRKILDHIGESTQPARIAPARGSLLWEAASAMEQAYNNPQWDMSAQPVPEFEFDQRIVW